MRQVFLIGCLFLFGSMHGITHARSIDDAAIADETNQAEWLTYGRTHNEQRFSPLTQINTKNVAGLKVDWSLELPDAVGLVSTPLVADGVMYFVGSRNIARAVDAVTGKLLWTFDPEVARLAPDRMRVSFVHGSRGMALWDDKVYFASIDGRLFGLDAATGKQVWSVATIDADQAMYITGAPKVFKGKVLIGNGGTENGPSRGYVTAYDAQTGKQAWRFHIVPGNPADGFESDAMEMAAKTWTGEWWKMGGGGNAWHAMTYDPEFDAIYIGTGNGAPWNRKIRSPGGGDNLFLCSIVALDPDTGEYRWHYQTSPGETWDYNSNMDIMLADLRIKGRDVKAIMHAPKNGFFYVIDRKDGKLISAEPIVDVNWASHIDLKTGRPVENPGVRYEKAAIEIAPGPLGAHNWPSMSFNPKLGLVYIPTIHSSYTYSDDEVDLNGWQPPDWQSPTPGEGMGVSAELVKVAKGTAQGSLQAWDPVKQQQVWEVPLEVEWNPGTLATAGDLVFQGTAQGDFVAYNGANGDALWRQKMGLGIAAPPITYMIDGRQYVALLVGWGAVFSALGGEAAYDLGWAYGLQPRRLVVFSLEGTQSLPPSPSPRPPEPLEAPFFEVQQNLAADGAKVFDNCSFCHGSGAVSGGATPDLRASALVVTDEAFANVVRGGALVERGMPAFNNLSDKHLQALQHYIREQAELARSAKAAP
jgi:quinohemoprotein ethanol dehydrogenase